MIHSFKFEDFESEILFEIDGYFAQLCCTPESKKVAFDLRYRAYHHSGSIDTKDDGLLYDEYDHQPNARIHLIWHAGRPIASVRSLIWASAYNWASTESIKAFWEEVHRNIGLEHNILESCRYAVDPSFTGRKSLFAQLLLFRVQDLSSQMDNCGHIITAVREKHVPFYERMLGFSRISEPIRLPWIDADIVLLMTTQEDSRKIVTSKGMPPCTEEEVEKYITINKRLIAQYHAD